jgi:serine/threonine protein kinase
MSPSFNFIERLKNKINKNIKTPKVIETIGLGNNCQIHLLDGLDEKQKKVVMKTTFNKNDLKIETEAMKELETFRKELKKDRELNSSSQTQLLLMGSSHIAKLCGTNQKDSINLRYIEGSTLNTLFRESPTKPTIEDSYSILIQVIAGLKFINKKMEHGDISSRNIMVDTKGKVKIIDFGRATKEPQKRAKTFIV